jgi:hypothetical protein
MVFDFSAISPSNSYLTPIFGKNAIFEAIFEMFGRSLRSKDAAWSRSRILRLKKKLKLPN